MFIQFYAPTPELAPHVERIMVLHTQFDASLSSRVKPFPPAVEQCLYFYPRHQIQAQDEITGQLHQVPFSILVGPQTSRVNLTMGIDHLVICVFFRAGGLRRLVGFPMPELTAHEINSADLWPQAISELYEQLNETDNYDLMWQLVNAFLVQQYRRQHIIWQPIDRVLQLMPNQPYSLNQLADLACLSPRQFERNFRERIGYGPKLYNRIARFSRAFRLKSQKPDLNWLDVAYLCGYYDRQHLLRDFREFAGTTPTLLAFADGGADITPYTVPGRLSDFYT